MNADLTMKVDAALALHPVDGTWEALCIATVRMAVAVAAFDKARADYIAARTPRKEETGG